MILLLLVFIGTLAGALVLRSKTAKLHAENQALVDEAAQRLETAKAAYDAIDPATAEGARLQKETEDSIVAEAQARAGALEEEIQGLDESIREIQKELEQLEEDEDTAYYLAVYDTLKEGMEKVEGYIEGN